MKPENKLDYKDWNRRLDAGDRSDSLQDLAAHLQNLSPTPDGPSMTFQVKLRAGLLDQYGRRPPVSLLPVRRWITWGLMLLAVVGLTLAGLHLFPGSVPAVSAAEILGKANLRLSERLATGDVVYDRLLLDWDQGGDWKRKGVIAELWRSADGTYLRYQLLDRSSLLFFEQYDGERLWRSSQVRPVEGREVTFVYNAPYVPGFNYLEDKQLVAQLLFRDLSNFWMYIDQMASADHSTCAALFCALSVLGEGWECTENGCTLNLGPVLEDKDFIITAMVTRQYRLPSGREVYEVRLSGPESGDQFYTNLKIDTTTFDLLEIEDFWHGQMHYRISLVERKTLAWRDLPEGFFQTVPEGIEVRQWNSTIPLGHKEGDRVWVISADPPQGASLSGVITARLEIGYRLTSVQEAEIEVGMSWVGHDSPYAIQGAKVPVTAGEGTVQMNVTVDTDQLPEGKWAVGAGFFDTMGVSPNTGWSGGGAPLGIYLEWCIRCSTEPPKP